MRRDAETPADDIFSSQGSITRSDGSALRTLTRTWAHRQARRASVAVIDGRERERDDRVNARLKIFTYTRLLVVW